jgi:hypothetical protein
MSDSKAVKVVADEVTIKVRCKPKNGEKGEKKATMSSSAPAPPAAAPAKRKASEKQLEHLKKAREARAAKKAAEGGTSKPAPKASTSKAAEPKPSTSKAAEKPKEEPKSSTFDFDELRNRARAAADKVISIKMVENIFYKGGGSSKKDDDIVKKANKHNRDQAAAIFARVLSELKIRKKKGVFISEGHALTERQGQLLAKAIALHINKKYQESDEATSGSSQRNTEIQSTLLGFFADEPSMKELYKQVPTA